MKNRVWKQGTLITGALVLAISMGAGAEEVSDDIIILYTNDVHCGIEDNIGYAGLAAYKEYAQTLTPYVTLVDCGDAVQGDFIGLVSDGSYIVDIMNELGYEFAICGNHEFDYGMDQLSALIAQSNAQYLGCNIRYTGSGENLLADMKPYEIVEYGDVSVGFVGVTTPESITSSTPTFFMEDGAFVYDFTSASGQEFYDCVQQYVDECREQGADYVIALTHIGDGEVYSPFSSNDLAQNTTGIDAILDGHEHSVIPCRVEKNLNGEEVLLSSTGTKLANIGQLIITADGNLSTSLISYYQDSSESMQEYIDVIQAVYEADLQEVVGTSEVNLTGYTADGVRLVRTRETNIGNFCADMYRIVADTDIALVNGGGVRADIPAGDVTYENLFAVHPYGNTLCSVEATGQEILDTLELAYSKVQSVSEENGAAVGEDGGFLHISGMKLVIDTSIEPSITLDENGMFVSVDGERRVKDVYVLNDDGEYEPIDPEAVYTVASHNYLMKEGGNGCTVFQDNTYLLDEAMADYQVLVEGLAAIGGVIGEEYADVEGRIVVE